MSFEVFEKLESKVQQAIDTIALLQMEIKEQNGALNQELQATKSGTESLVRENEQLKQEQATWQERLRTLLGKMEEV